MPRLLPLICVVVAMSLAGSLTGSCSSREGAEAPQQQQPTQQRPKDSADLCEALGRESLDRLVPGGEPEAEADDYGKFTEASCTVHSPVDTSAGSRNLRVEVNRYTENAGRLADETCREAIRSSKLQNAEDWQHGSAKELPVHLGDVTEAQVRSVRYDAEAEILLCRSGLYVRVHYQADQVDQDEVAGQAEDLARDYLDTHPR